MCWEMSFLRRPGKRGLRTVLMGAQVAEGGVLWRRL